MASEQGRHLLYV